MSSLYHYFSTKVYAVRLNNIKLVSKSVTRVEAFSDAVFAISITLLIIEIKVPRIDSVHSANDLISKLLNLWPSFFAYFYSFGGILVQWVLHHNILSYLNKTSGPFLYANGFLLFTIAFFPFPTALLAQYINTKYATPAIVFYAIGTVINSVSWFLFFRFINKPKRLLNNAFSHDEYDLLKASNRVALPIYFSTALLAIWLPYIALIINLSLWMLWAYLSLVNFKSCEYKKTG